MRITTVVLLSLAGSPALADKLPAKAAPPKQPAIDAATAALIPDAGWLVTYQTDARRVIARITKTGVKELLGVPEDSGAHVVWLDAKTLLHVQMDFSKNIEVKWIVDGVIDAKRTIRHKAAVWGLKSEDDSVNIEGAWRAADGGIWLEHCVSEMLPDCTKSAWLRVDGAAVKASRTRPAKLTGFGDAVKPPTVKAPAGFSGKIIKIKSKENPKQRVTAIECTGPKGKLVWSEESPPMDPADGFTPKKVRWISATPPLFEVEGPFVNPVGQVNTEQYVFRDCGAEPYNYVFWIGDRAWAYNTRGDDNLYVQVDDKPIAILVGYRLMAAPK